MIGGRNYTNINSIMNINHKSTTTERLLGQQKELNPVSEDNLNI